LTINDTFCIVLFVDALVVGDETGGGAFVMKDSL